jgi:hypothetical protein
MNNSANILILFIICSALFIFSPGIYAQSDGYVDDDAPGDPEPGDPSVSDPLKDGLAAHPFCAVQEAIDVAPVVLLLELI